MIDALTRIWDFLRKHLSLQNVAFAYAAYLLIERAGVFRFLPGLWRESLHSLPSRLFGLLLALIAAAGLVRAAREAWSWQRSGRIMVDCAVIVLAIGLWTSYYTRFEGRTLRAEGESFSAFPGEYVRESVFKASHASFPQVGITIQALEPVTEQDPASLREVTASILYAGRSTRQVREGKLGSRWPLITDWTSVRITDFGYMPTYMLTDRSGRVLESDKVYQKLYPAGAEEYFRTQFLGYLFYVQCFPDYIDREGRPGTLSAIPRNPMFKLRIVRNKDIVYNGLLKPSEKVRFDNAVISIPDVKMWVEVTLVRDLGLPVAALGGLLLLAGVALGSRGRKGKAIL